MKADITKHATAMGWFGILAVAVFCIMWLACMAADDTWVWGENAISDFGVSDTDAADYFEYGCMVSGILLAAFGAGLALTSGPRTGLLAAGTFYALAGVCIIFIGQYDSDYNGGNAHSFFAWTAALLLLGAMIASAAQYWQCGKLALGGIAVTLFCIICACVLAFEFEKWEVWSAVVMLAWTAMVAGYQMTSHINRGRSQ